MEKFASAHHQYVYARVFSLLNFDQHTDNNNYGDDDTPLKAILNIIITTVFAAAFCFCDKNICNTRSTAVFHCLFPLPPFAIPHFVSHCTGWTANLQFYDGFSWLRKSLPSHLQPAETTFIRREGEKKYSKANINVERYCDKKCKRTHTQTHGLVIYRASGHIVFCSLLFVAIYYYSNSVDLAYVNCSGRSCLMFV